MTANEQMEKFLSKFDELAEGLRQKRKESVIFLDANIDLLSLHRAESITYLNLIFSHGYLQCITKATRIQSLSKSLIDHVLLSSNATNIISGTIISDVSDHFSHLYTYQALKKVTNRIKLLARVTFP